MIADQLSRAMNVGAAAARKSSNESRGVIASTLMEILTTARTDEERGLLLSLFLGGFVETS
jgi:hypothetical protein